MTGVHRGASQDVPLSFVFVLDAGGLRAGLWSSGAAAWSLRKAALPALAQGCTVLLSLRTLRTRRRARRSDEKSS